MIDQRQQEQGEVFARLHEAEPFLIPNPWDAGSAVILEGLGFKALATTSSGFAFTLGRHDGAVTVEEVLAHIRALTHATGLPVSADLENGFATEPELVAKTITAAAEAGAVGGSIEDWAPSGQIYDFELAVDRVRAAVEAARALPFRFTLTARAENHFRGNADLEDTIRRLKAYEDVGADVLYAPGLQPHEVRRVREKTTQPLNALAYPGVSMQDFVEAGAQRVSIGGGLAWAVATSALELGERLRDSGDFSIMTGPGAIAEWLSRP